MGSERKAKLGAKMEEKVYHQQNLDGEQTIGQQEVMGAAHSMGSQI